MSIPNTNDNTKRAPYLRIDLVAETLMDLPSNLKKSLRDHYRWLVKEGFSGVQNGDPHLCRSMGLNYVTSGHVSNVGQTARLISNARMNGADCITLHVGNGLESDSIVDRLVEDILNQAEKANYPVFIETHRSTITQDMFRTVRMVNQFPEIRFNGDFSHWYTGQEMRYGGFKDMAEKLAFIEPVFRRVRYIHGRIGNGGAIQVDVTRPDMKINVDYFKEIWMRCFRGFLESASPGDYFIFAPELLSPQKHYALNFYKNARLEEEGSRIQQAVVLKNIAQGCWKKIQLSEA